MRFLLGFFLLSIVQGSIPETEHLLAFKAKEVTISSARWNASDVFLDAKTSLWRSVVDSTLISGRVISFFADGSVSKCMPVQEGKKEGTVLTYFPDGRLKFSECYKRNKLHGEVRRWVLEEQYQLVAQLVYHEGKLHGEQRKWYASGELHQLLHVENGQEQGSQQAFRKNGALYANYEARQGRIFGLKRTQLCFELDNEYVVYEQ